MCFEMIDLIKQNKELIFVDETGVNLHTNVHFGFSKRGKKISKKVAGKGRNISATAVTKNRLISYMLFDGVMRSQDYKYFIINLTKELLETQSINDFMIIHDRNSTNKSLFTNTSALSFINTLLLPPYSRELNMIKGFFNYFKSKFRFRLFKKKINLINYIIKKTNYSCNNECLKFYVHSLEFYAKALRMKDFKLMNKITKIFVIK